MSEVKRWGCGFTAFVDDSAVRESSGFFPSLTFQAPTLLGTEFQ